MPMPEKTVALMGRQPQLDPQEAMRLFVENALSPSPPEDRSSTRSSRTARRIHRSRGLVRASGRRCGARREGGSARSRVPTLVIHGTADNVVDAGNAPSSPTRFRMRGSSCSTASATCCRGSGRMSSPRSWRGSSRKCAHDRPLAAQHCAPHAAARRDRLPGSRGHVRRARPPLGRARRRAARAGLEHGDRVATLTGNTPEHVRCSSPARRRASSCCR